MSNITEIIRFTKPNTDSNLATIQKVSVGYINQLQIVLSFGLVDYLNKIPYPSQSFSSTNAYGDTYHKCRYYNTCILSAYISLTS